MDQSAISHVLHGEDERRAELIPPLGELGDSLKVRN